MVNKHTTGLSGNEKMQKLLCHNMNVSEVVECILLIGF